VTGRLKGKTALITAAGQGIGRAIAEAFVAEGAKVWATDVDAAKLEGVARAKRRKLNVLSTRAVEAFANKTGPVDVLINCAGFVHHGTILECDDGAWDFSFDLNVRSMHRVIKAYLPGMLAQGSGAIVNIASGASSIRGIPNRYVYGTTKAAVIGLTKAVAADFIGKGVRCNAVAPGTVQSPSLDERVATLAAQTGESIEETRAAFVSRQPMGRLGTAAEIAAAAVYLASEESAFTTGTTIVVDGGFSL
jgi:2-keto-3-deoxy-L-fuconate dehydrogenase